jgi:hypothetical protein
LRDDVIIVIAVVLLLVLAYATLYVAFLIVVVANIRFLHGYPRFGDLQPGPFVSDRYNFEWFLLMFSVVRFVPALLLLWSLNRITQLWKRDIHRALVQIGILLGIFTLICQLIISCGFCNNPFFPASICNSPDYCLVFGADHPDRCAPPANVTLPDLLPNIAFTRWIWFQGGFLILEVLMIFANVATSTYVRRLLYRQTFA